MSGILTGVGASAQVFFFRWLQNASPQTADALIQRIRMRWQTLTAFTAAQEISFKLFKWTAWVVSPTGGTSISTASPNAKKSTRHPPSGSGLLGAQAIMANTGALTPGTYTVAAEPFGSMSVWSQQGAAPNVLGGETVFDGDNDSGALLELQEGEGFLARNEIAMGAAGTGRLIMEVDWAEADKR